MSVAKAMEYDVVVVGGGPSGLAAARTLRELGVQRVAVIEREPTAGGIPRHCGHPPFGAREFRRVYSGPRYARRLVEWCGSQGVEILTDTTVVAIGDGAQLHLSTPQGERVLRAHRVVLATGTREMSRAGRLIGGDRTRGILSTGALQSLIYLHGMRPFQSPVILGSELVAFSAILTCRKAGIRPRAIIEPNERVTARSFSAGLPALLGIPLLMMHEVDSIVGNGRVEAVNVINRANQTEQCIKADGVVVSGCFTPESTLARMAGVTIDPNTGGPLVDQYGRTSNSSVFATGNALRPVETAGWSWQEGRVVGTAVAMDIAGKLTHDEASIRIHAFDPVRYVVPQILQIPPTRVGLTHLQLRVCRPVAGELIVSVAGQCLWRQRVKALPERRVLVPMRIFKLVSPGASVEITISEQAT